MSKQLMCQLNQIQVTYKDKVVHIYRNDELDNFLENTENGALVLAQFILEEYQNRMGKPLDISVDSLAIEIIVHVYADRIAENMQELPEEHGGMLSNVLGKMGTKARVHTQTIDCGERSEDSNRIVWDSLEPFKHLIYGMIQKK